MNSGKTRLQVAKDSLTDAVDELFDELGEDMNISLLGFGTPAGTGLCSGGSKVGYSCSSDSDCGSGYTCEDQFVEDYASNYGFLKSSDQSVLEDRISAYVYSGVTHTSTAVYYANNMLDEDDADSIPNDGNTRRIMVLLSDGQPSSGYDPASMATLFKNKGEDYELYTIALTSTSTLIEDMNEWSSNNGAEKNPNGIDYSYDGDTVEELQEAYESILDSILGVTVSIVSSNSGIVKLYTDTVREGEQVDLPWPENFKCDPTKEQDLPLQMTFLGIGTVELSGMNVQYCAP